MLFYMLADYDRKTDVQVASYSAKGVRAAQVTGDTTDFTCVRNFRSIRTHTESRSTSILLICVLGCCTVRHAARFP